MHLKSFDSMDQFVCYRDNDTELYAEEKNKWQIKVLATAKRSLNDAENQEMAKGAIKTLQKKVLIHVNDPDSGEQKVFIVKKKLLPPNTALQTEINFREKSNKITNMISVEADPKIMASLLKITNGEKIDLKLVDRSELIGLFILADQLGFTKAADELKESFLRVLRFMPEKEIRELYENLGDGDPRLQNLVEVHLAQKVLYRLTEKSFRYIASESHQSYDNSIINWNINLGGENPKLELSYRYLNTEPKNLDWKGPPKIAAFKERIYKIGLGFIIKTSSDTERSLKIKRDLFTITDKKLIAALCTITEGDSDLEIQQKIAESQKNAFSNERKE